jgi:hypothetical protein
VRVSISEQQTECTAAVPADFLPPCRTRTFLTNGFAVNVWMIVWSLFG